jgi:hypothetical protein
MSTEYEYDHKAVNLHGKLGAYTALFVKSHSNNVSPRLPRWSLYGFTEKNRAMAYVCQHAHYADGGMTCGPEGREISSEHWLGLWRIAIAKADTLTQKHCMRLEFVEGHCVFDTPMTHLQPLLELAESMGIKIEVQSGSNAQRTGKSVALDVFNPDHCDLIWRATRPVFDFGNPRKTACLDPHRVMRSIADMLGSFFFWKDSPDKDAEIADKRTSSFTLPVKMVKTSFAVEGQPVFTDDRVMCLGDYGRVIAGGSDALDWFCRDILVGLEEADPGCAESAVRKFKKTLRTADVAQQTSLWMYMKEPINTRFKTPPSAWQMQEMDRIWSASKYIVGTADLGQIHVIADQCAALSLSHVMELYVTIISSEQQSKSRGCQEALFA